MSDKPPKTSTPSWFWWAAAIIVIIPVALIAILSWQLHWNWLPNLWFQYAWSSDKGNGPEALQQTIVYALIAAVLIPAVRHFIAAKFEDVHKKIDEVHDTVRAHHEQASKEHAANRTLLHHIIESTPGIANHVPGLEDRYQPKENLMTDTSGPARIYGQGRKPPHPPGSARRLPLPWLHEIDSEVAGDVPVSYPLDLTNGMTKFPMWGNGPDPTLTINDAEGKGQPVGDCDYAGKANLNELDGNPNALTANIVVNAYDTYEANSQGVPLGSEQDEGVVMSDSMIWCLTHDWTGKTVPLGEGIVAAFIPVERATVPATMAKYRKALLMGVNLTNADQQTFPNWDTSASNPPNPQEGHVVVLARLLEAPAPGDVFGKANPISWQQLVNASARWMNECPEEFWMPVTPADRTKLGDAAYDQLVGWMALLPGFEGQGNPTPAPKPPVVVPPVVVTPPPTPDNPTPAPVPHESLWDKFLDWLRSEGFTVTGPANTSEES